MRGAGHRELLQSDITFFSDGSKNHNDTPIIAMGVKGMLYVELRLTTMSRDLHSQYAPVLPSAAWQMVELLGKLRRDGKVQIPGFYDGIVPVSPQEKAIYDTLPDVTEDLQRTYHASPSYDPYLGYYGQLNGMPSFNLSGLCSGHTGKGTATVLTSTAMARLDMRLVAGQDGEKILASLKGYIRELGYNNVEVICHGITPPSKTPLDTPILRRWSGPHSGCLANRWSTPTAPLPPRITFGPPFWGRPPSRCGGATLIPTTTPPTST